MDKRQTIYYISMLTFLQLYIRMNTYMSISIKRIVVLYILIDFFVNYSLCGDASGNDVIFSSFRNKLSEI